MAEERITLTCKFCGKIFEPVDSKQKSPAQVKRRKYCGRTCAELAQVYPHPMTMNERFCFFIQYSLEGCWLWTGNKQPSGYGIFDLVVPYTRSSRQRIRAHRLSFLIFNGLIPDGLNVLHRCDNPPCVNPDHLFLGTHADNSHDRDAKGRTARGERSGMAKLTEQQVCEIRAKYQWHKRGNSKALAAEYGVTQGTILTVVSKRNQRRSWQHLKG